MFAEPSAHARAAASGQFDAATRRAFFERILKKLSGGEETLLPFDEVLALIGVTSGKRRKSKPESIPLDKIVGSVGRYRDFTRTFLPTENVSKERWVRVASLLEGPGWPPIEVYKVGDVYFVIDGNHRVSVARALGLKDIEAYVTEIQLPPGVQVTPETDLKRLLLELGRAQFLEKTRLHELRPDVHIEVTEPGLYRELLEHIDVHRYYLGLEKGRYIPYEEAVKSFIDNVYLPIVEEIRKSGILKQFPGRTETDLYLWIARHREELRQKYGMSAPPSPKTTVSSFAEVHGTRPLQRVLKQMKHVILPQNHIDALIPEEVRSAQPAKDEGSPETSAKEEPDT